MQLILIIQLIQKLIFKMNNKKCNFFILLFYVFIFSHISYAETWETAAPPVEKTVNLGIFPQKYFSKSATMINVQLGYDFSSVFELNFRAGFGGLDSYFGLFFKHFLLATQLFDLSLDGGIFSQNGMHGDFGFILSRPFGNFEPYLAETVQFRTGDEKSLGLGVSFGTAMGITTWLKAFVEYHMNVNDSHNAISAGVKTLL